MSDQTGCVRRYYDSLLLSVLESLFSFHFIPSAHLLLSSRKFSVGFLVISGAESNVVIVVVRRSETISIFLAQPILASYHHRGINNYNRSEYGVIHSIVTTLCIGTHYLL